MQRVQLVLDSNVRRVSHGTALLGGSPFRVIRLSRAGADQLDAWLSSEVAAGLSEAPTPAVEELRRRLLAAGMVHPLPVEPSGLTCAFVIPVRGDVEGLVELLRSLRREFERERIIVVDDASPDPVAVEQVATRFNAELLRHQVNTGPGEARNTGWRAVLSDEQRVPDIVVFVDADVCPVSGAISLLLAHFGEDSVAAVAPRVTARPGTDSVAHYEAANSPLDMGAEPAVVAAGSPVSYVPTATLAIRPAVLEKLSGFADMRFGEDVDLIWRLLDAHQIVRYEPRAVVYHRNRVSVKEFARQRFGYGSAAAPLATNHRTKVAPLQMPLDLVATTLAALLGGPVLRAGSLGAAAFQTKRLADKLEVLADGAPVEAARLRVRGHGYAVSGLATAATRAWMPVLMFTPRLRRALAAAVVVPALWQWIGRRPATNPASHVAMRAIDHASYCAGVWAGAWRERSLAALLPDVRLRDSND